MRRLLFALLVGVCFPLAGCTSSDISPLVHQSLAAGSQGPEKGPFRQQRWLIPWPEQHIMMTATFWRPRGKGPFPLAVISHASTEDPNERIEDPTPRYESTAQWLVQHGYAVVLPVRPGHGPTGGAYLEDQGGCANADYVRSGQTTAASIEATIDYMLAQPFLKKKRVIVVGQSAGGWGALALASRNLPMVRAIINFSGGRGGRSLGKPNVNCAADRLVAAAGEFGRTARIPTLWLYTKNDSFFGPKLSKRMADAFRRGGGRVEYHLLPAFGEDGHLVMVSPDAIPIWAPIVEKFLVRMR